MHVQGQVPAGEEEEVEEVDLGEPEGLQQLGEEHALEKEGVRCPREGPVLAVSGSIFLPGVYPDSKALDPFQM